MSRPVNAVAGFLRRRVRECAALARWLRRHWIAAAAVLLAYALLQHRLMVNVTSSLPYRLVWVEYGAVPQRGELMIFTFEGQPLPSVGYLRGIKMFKRVAGIAGDRIAVDGRLVRVEGREIGVAKQYARNGDSLSPIAAGVIPPDHFFAQSDSLDSFDSRYAQAGLVHRRQIVGVAHVLF